MVEVSENSFVMMTMKIMKVMVMIAVIMKIVMMMIMILYHFNYYLVLPKSNVKKIIQSSAFTSTELNPTLDSIITILNIYNQDVIKFVSCQVNKIVVVTVSYFYT